MSFERGMLGCTLCAVLFAACVGGDSTAEDGGVDATADGTSDAPSDAAVDVLTDSGPKLCDPNAPFGAPTLVNELDTTATEQGLRLSADGLTGYFAAMEIGSDAGTLSADDIFKATRATTSNPFGARVALASINAIGASDTARRLRPTA